MNAERLLKGFLTLVQIDSVTDHEAAVAAWCKEAFAAAGCAVSEDQTQAQTGSESGNLIITLPAKCDNGQPLAGPVRLSEAPAGTRGRLYFSAHMDTVSPGVGIVPVIADGVIRSAGQTILGSDDKVGIATLLELVECLKESPQAHPEVVILLSVGEEGGLKGAAAIDGSDFRGEPCYVIDADGKPGTVIIAAPFHDEFTALFNGRAAHAGVNPEAGISAIKMAAEAIAAMPLGRIDDLSTANIGTIAGGLANNVVAASCTVKGEYRSLDLDRLDDIKSRLGAAMTKAAEQNGGTVSIDWQRAYPGFAVAEDDELVQLVLRVARELGLPALTRVSGGGSDGNVLAEKGLRPVVLGSGMSAIHSIDEHLAVQDLEDLTQLVAGLCWQYQPA